MRDLTGPSQVRAIRDLLQGIFAMEAMKPSKPLWLLSGWITDIGIIDNRARQFNTLDPSWPTAMVPLSAVLRTILERGGGVSIVLREDQHNRYFTDRMRGLRGEFPQTLRILLAPDFHEKCLVGTDYVLNGSMNLTYRGVEVNDEHVVFRTEPSIVAERRLVLATLWGSKLDAATRS
ncbi:MAG TPA: phospholipase D-like domain-containing protein DpdK [Burkholderiales bacterium]|nr:phospholipase D-like domain-containing protein DpdK [Burkholderiales bacterium]